jgi:hypothetical protein
MRAITVACLGLGLAACSGPGSLPAPDGSLRGVIQDMQRPGERQAAQRAADDAKCREFGFTPGTDAYGNCRLQLEQSRKPVVVIDR